MRLSLSASILGLLLVPTVAAQNCSNTSTGNVPLIDLGPGIYQGFEGGLYTGGSNVPPPTHAARGLTAMADVVPRDAGGAPATGGRIVVLSIGMSNTTQEYSTWVAIANADPFRNPAVTVVDGAQGGQDAVVVANPTANFWTVVDQRLANAGVTPAQVQVVWLKEAIAGATGGFPGGAQTLQGLLAQIARNLTARFPNLRLCFCSSRTYGGYATTSLNPEPYAYETGFAVKWLIEQQIAGDPQLNSDPAVGPVVAPWLGFGPYLWTDGTTARSDGLVWTCADVQPDGVHPSPSGRAKVADLLQQFFTTDPRAAPWYVGSGTAAAFATYGAGCPGANGVPGMRSNSLPSLGNANFRIGIDHAAPGALALLWFAGAPVTVPFVGTCTVHVDVLSGWPVWGAVVSANGSNQQLLPVANDPTWLGLQICCQWFVEDAAGAAIPGFLGLAMTPAAAITFGL